MSELPRAGAGHDDPTRKKIHAAVAARNLASASNNTKWDELINHFRELQGWRPSYRSKCVTGYVSEWDVEWFYHLPFPLLSIEWLDVDFLQKTREHRLPPRVTVIDHSEWIAPLLQRIGLDFRQGATMIRIFGYYPRSLELFDA